MFKVAILDKRAEEIVRGFNAAAHERQLQIRFQPFTQLDNFYRQLNEEAPALVYMHHTWDGVKTSTIVAQIASRAPQSRVVVFTGQDVNVPELIDCVRSGVVDYWKSGKHSMEYMLQRIVQHCNDANATLARQQLASGPALQLAEKAGTLAKRIKECEEKCTALDASLSQSRSADHKHNLTEHVRTVRFVVYVCTFTAAWVILKARSNIETWALLGFTTIVAIFLLFIDGKVASALVKWTGGSVDLRGSGKEPNATDKMAGGSQHNST